LASLSIYFIIYLHWIPTEFQIHLQR